MSFVTAPIPKKFVDAAHAAVAASQFAYSPYSKFNVGAALLHGDGSMTIGANWENCIYQATCGERTAICSANVQGKRTATAIAVYGRVADGVVDPNSYTVPCGLCRQMLHEVGELSDSDLDVVMVTADTKRAAVVKLSQLLPSAFGPTVLGFNVKKLAEDPAEVKALSAAAALKHKSSKKQSSKKHKTSKKARK